ncbi:hypothetical protein [Pseudomonas helleri]|uniref:hypothetical protein n=1 Tax=Pseudomonas helleri TaxID=1608996 RepID=UPI0012FB5F75|nr:hypothetical protein [Pseudomonas helleri]
MRILGKLLTPYLRHDRVESLVMKSALCLHLECKLLNNVYLVLCIFVYKCRLAHSDIHASQQRRCSVRVLRNFEYFCNSLKNKMNLKSIKKREMRKAGKISKRPKVCTPKRLLLFDARPPRRTQ